MPSDIQVDTQHVKGLVLPASGAISAQRHTLDEVKDEVEAICASPERRRRIHLLTLLGGGLRKGFFKWLQIYCWSVLVSVVMAKMMPSSQQWLKKRRKVWLAIVIVCGMYISSFF